MRRKILILGGAGFLGNNLCAYLSEGGYEVYCFDKICPKRKENIHYIEGDFFCDRDLFKAVEGKDCIIHAVSTVNPGNSNIAYMRGYEKDFIQTIKLFDLLIGKDIKVIFLSSGGTVYGDHKVQPINEETLPRPINHYGNIKLSIENAMRAFNYQMHTNFIIARISNPYGKGQDFHKGVGFIDAAFKNTIQGNPIEIWGDGKNIRDYIYVEDVCRMLECLIEYKGDIDTFNISTGIGTAQEDVIKVIRAMGLCPRVIYKEKRSVDVRKIVLDNTRIISIWNKKPKSLEEGMKLYYQLLKENIT